MKQCLCFVFILFNLFGNCQCNGNAYNLNGIYDKMEKTMLYSTDSIIIYNSIPYKLLSNSATNDNTELLFPKLQMGNYIAFFKNTKKVSCITRINQNKISFTLFYLNGLIRKTNDSTFKDNDTLITSKEYYREGGVHNYYYSNKDTIINTTFRCNGDTLQSDRKTYIKSCLDTRDCIFWDKNYNRIELLLNRKNKKYHY